MRKQKVCFNFILCLVLCGQIHALSPDIIKQGKKMVKLLESARQCQLEHDDSGRLLFCTGLELSMQDLTFLKKLDLKSCKNFLTQMKYKVHNVKLNQKVEGVSDDELKAFFNSTKLALILHKERIILLKGEAKRGDCLHEIIHFYQRHRPKGRELAPLVRKNEERRLQFLLEKSVVEVERLEKAGEIDEAKKVASQLQPFIALQREWQNMIHWLDEKEVYQLFFDFGELVATNERDYDVALANLVRLQGSLPWDLKERVLFYAAEELNKKYAQVAIPTLAMKKKMSNEIVLNDSYNKGIISRDDFEKQVIGLRKYRANEDYKKAKTLSQKIAARLRLRQFDKERVSAIEAVAPISFQIENELWHVKINGKKILIDTGAQMSVLPPSFLDGLSEKDISLLRVKSIQTSYGSSLQAPIAIIKKSFQIGGRKVAYLHGAFVDLKLPGFDGILGMDFFSRFNGGKWLFDFKKKTMAAGELKKGKSFSLENNGLGKIDSLEFVCDRKSKTKVRLDSGSQFFGEKRKGTQLDKCSLGVQTKKVKVEAFNSVLFSRGVSANLGAPFLKNFSKMGIDIPKKNIILKVD